MHSVPITIPGAPHNFTLTYIHSQLSSFAYSTMHSLTSLPNFSSESATSAVSSANNSWFISNLPPFTLRSSSQCRIYGGGALEAIAPKAHCKSATCKCGLSYCHIPGTISIQYALAVLPFNLANLQIKWRSLSQMTIIFSPLMRKCLLNRIKG